MKPNIKKWIRYTVLTAVAVLAIRTVAAKAQGTATLNINATVAARAELTLSPTTINFPDASPTSTPSIAADSAVTVTAKVRSSGTPTLRVLANGDLTSGSDTIDIGNITWTASGAPFIGGTMDKTTQQDAATLNAGSGIYTGAYSYSLVNSWSYPVGNYTASATYTLTAP